MKTRNILLLALAAAVLASAGCTAMQEVGDDVSNKFDQGITGQGRLVSPNQVADSALVRLNLFETAATAFGAGSPSPSSNPAPFVPSLKDHLGGVGCAAGRCGNLLLSRQAKRTSAVRCCSERINSSNRCNSYASGTSEALTNNGRESTFANTKARAFTCCLTAKHLCHHLES